MAFGRVKLTQDERVAVTLRTHGRALVFPAILFFIVIVVTASLIGLYPTNWSPIVDWVTIGLAAVLIAVFCLAPFLRWRTSTYTITTKRIIARQGILTREGHDLPLSRIQDVSYNRSLFDRLFGCGTLELTTASDDPVLLHDIPDVEQVQLLLADLIYSKGGELPAETAEPR